jgi:hypothetical protein
MYKLAAVIPELKTVFPPTYKLPAIPAPPANVNAPDVGDALCVVFDILTIPDICVSLFTDKPPYNTNEPDVDETALFAFNNTNG